MQSDNGNDKVSLVKVTGFVFGAVALGYAAYKLYQKYNQYKNERGNQ